MMYVQTLVVGPYIAYCLCSRVASVDVVVPAPALLSFAPLSIVTAVVMILYSGTDTEIRVF